MIQEENKKPIYINSVEIGMSHFDFSLDMSYRGANSPLNDMRVVMSPQHYKAMIQVMIDNLNKYEELFGSIPMEVNQDVFTRLKEQGMIRDAVEPANGRKE
jgi:hypothetical protein